MARCRLCRASLPTEFELYARSCPPELSRYLLLTLRLEA